MSTGTNNKKIVIAGAGQMAGYYAGPMINKLGIDRANIMVVDINEAALGAFSTKFGVQATTSIDAALEGGADILLNLVNSPSHLSILKKAVAAGVPHVFSEKPVVPSIDLHELQSLDLRNTKIVTGYVINYSGAVARLVELIGQHDLTLMKMVVEWGKDRTGNSRPTAGTVEDEACHGVRLMTYLMGIANDWKVDDDVYVRASVLREPYVDDEVQKAAMEIDSSFVADPPSLVQLHAEYDNPWGTPSHLLLRSDFTRAENERKVGIRFGEAQSGKALYKKAMLTFDLPADKQGEFKDVLQFGPVGKPMETFEFQTNKLADMMRSFLAFAEGAPLDPRLSNLESAIHDVRFAAAVIESDREDGIRYHI